MATHVANGWEEKTEFERKVTLKALGMSGMEWQFLELCGIGGQL